MQYERGCKQDAPIPLFEVDRKYYKRCPITFYDTEIHYWTAAYNHYKKGFLPIAGGIFNQTHKYMEVMGFMASEFG